MAWKNVQYENGKYRTSEGGGGGGSSTFAGLDDVSFDNLQNGQVPKYNSDTHKWENADESGGGGTVTDVEIDGVSVVNPQGVAEIETPNANGIEYDNQQSGLSATDVQDAIDELAQGSGSEWHEYSTDEKVVGKWIDGKPLYEKTWDLGSSGLAISYNSWTASSIPKAGIDSVVCARVTNQTGGAYFGDVMVSRETNNTYISFQTARNNNNTEIIRYITLQYTKTTDV